MAATALTSFKSSRVGANAVAGSPAAAVNRGHRLRRRRLLDRRGHRHATEGNTYTNDRARPAGVGREDQDLAAGEVFDVNGNVAYSKTVAASKVFVLGPLPVDKYGSTVKFKASNAAVTVSVVQLNGLQGFSVS